MMRYRQRPTKAQRRVALAAMLNGMDPPPELPSEVEATHFGKRIDTMSNLDPQPHLDGEVSTAITTEIIKTPMVSTTDAITITEDGKTLVGSEWTLPEDYIDEDIASGRLVSLKGTTPPTLPTLGDDQAGDGQDTTTTERN